ncbi:MAG: hypothetical protein AAFV43_04070 [Planctomycetota bacterium]
MKSVLSLVGRRRGALCLLPAMLIACGASIAPAQDYSADKFDKKLSSRGTLQRNYAKQPSGDLNERREFEAYITKYYLPAMTQPSPEALEDLGKLRSDFFGKFLWPAAPEIQTWMTQQAMEWAKRIGRSSRYHPAVQFNAIYTMGLLDAKYASRGQSDPTPLPAANDELNVLARAAMTRENIPNRVLAAALVGLERQTRYFANLPEKNQKDTLKTLFGVLKAEKLAGDYDREVLGWIYATAGRGLAGAGGAGPRGAFFSIVAKRASDKSLNLDSRAELVSILAQMNAQKGSVNAAPAAKVLRDLAAGIAKYEGKVAKEFEDMQIRGGAREIATGRNNRGRRFRLDEDREVVLVREDLLLRLVNLQKGVRAVAAVASDAEAASLKAIDTAIEGARKRIIDPKEIDLNVAESVKQMAEQIAEAATVEEPAAADVATAQP